MLVPLSFWSVGNAVEPDDQKSAEGKRQRHPDEIGAERGHRLNTVDKCHADESHMLPVKTAKKRPSNQQPHVGTGCGYRCATAFLSSDSTAGCAVS